MLVRDVIQKTASFLKEKGIESARLDADLLISRALNWQRIQLYLKFDYPMSESELLVCREWVRRRARGEPIAYIIGERDFFASSFHVEPGVLVPRPETEGLVELALAFAKQSGKGGPEQDPFRIVDLGTGTGCVGLSIVKELPRAVSLCVDSSEIAERVARRNAEALGLTSRARVELLEAEQLTQTFIEQALGGRVDAVLANPPYVAENDPNLAPNVSQHEPALALYSPDGGLSHIRSWAAVAAAISPPGALVAFEIGSEQGSAARLIFEQTNAGGSMSGQTARRAYANIAIIKDLARLDRFVRAERVGGG